MTHIWGLIGSRVKSLPMSCLLRPPEATYQGILVFLSLYTPFVRRQALRSDLPHVTMGKSGEVSLNGKHEARDSSLEPPHGQEPQTSQGTVSGLLFLSLDRRG